MNKRIFLSAPHMSGNELLYIEKVFEIGENSIIGAGSVVVKNIVDFKKAYGNPCKEVGNIDE